MKPLITFFILTYNQEDFIFEAVLSAFSQDYSPLEIILSDDCSTDNTFSIINNMAASYNGPHKIILNQNEKNLGIGAHINKIMELAHGELIVAAAGDDVSVPDRTMKIYYEYEASKRSAKSIFSNSITIDVNGKKDRLRYERPKDTNHFSPDMIVKQDSILSGCSHAWSRDVFSTFGPLITPLTCEDMVIPFRSSLLGKINYIHEPLVLYRQHGSSLWNYKWHDKKRIIAKKEIQFYIFWMYERLAIFKNWNKDLQIMKNISPSRKEELQYLQNIVRERIHDMERNIEMLNVNFIKKIKIILQRKTKDSYRHNSMRHEIGFFLFPKIYKYYIECKFSFLNFLKINR
ncbi:MAG TPA: glycosyltransferase [Syntrophales bacterium]|nr:glycosyltransferase [Syntrophales bacterium]HQN78070.1 glycosyltransferase [Syntrophales bacterium]